MVIPGKKTPVSGHPGGGSGMKSDPSPSFMRGFTGIPFRDKGRDRTGCDCWGLVRLVYMEVAGIELPEYGEISSADLLRVARSMRDGAVSSEWEDVGGPPRRPLDVALMRRPLGGPGPAWHCGVMATDRLLLHTEYPVDSHLVEIDQLSVAARIVSFHRHRESPR